MNRVNYPLHYCYGFIKKLLTIAFPAWTIPAVFILGTKNINTGDCFQRFCQTQTLYHVLNILFRHFRIWVQRITPGTNFRNADIMLFHSSLKSFYSFRFF